MPQRDTISWNTTLFGYAVIGNTKFAQYLFDSIPERDVDTLKAGIGVSQSTYASAFRCCAGLATFSLVILAREKRHLPSHSKSTSSKGTSQQEHIPQSSSIQNEVYSHSLSDADFLNNEEMNKGLKREQVNFLVNHQKGQLPPGFSTEVADFESPTHTRPYSSASHEPQQHRPSNV
ncbi:hypothetical protein HN51_050600 [Arachis hypogaea]